jgi:transcriptional regulator with XRE-family HTH domain
MGHARRRPKHLARKLLKIREALGLSQVELTTQLNVGIRFSEISKYENDQREPPLNVLLAYSRLAKVPLEQIVDDDQDLKLSP